MKRFTLVTLTLALASTMSPLALANATLDDSIRTTQDNAYNVSKNLEFLAYIGIRGGLNNIDIEDLSNKNVITGSPFIGTGFRYNRWGLRGEFEANFNDKKTWRDSDPDFGDMSLSFRSTNYIFNAYADIYPIENTVIYATAGVGAADIDVDADFFGIKNTDQDETNVLWQVGAGAQYYPLSHLGLEIGVRYQDLGNYAFKMAGESVKLDVVNTQFYGGILLRY